MNRINIFFIAFICCFFTTAALYAEHDDSLRIDQNLNLKLNENFLFKFYMFHQMDENRKNFDYFETGTGLQYQAPLSWLSFLLYYQQSFSETADDKWELEKKPSASINITADFLYFRIFEQIRYEYRILPEWSDYRIKNYLALALRDVFLKPYTGWEIYYENHDNAVMLHRVKFGINETVYNNVSLGIYYRFDFSRIEDRWEHTKQLAGVEFTLNY